MNQNWNKYEVLNSWNRGNELKVKHVSCIRIIYLFLVKYILSKKLDFMKKKVTFYCEFFYGKKVVFYHDYFYENNIVTNFILR